MADILNSRDKGRHIKIWELGEEKKKKTGFT